MIMARGGALSELMEQGCSVSCIEPGLRIRLSLCLSAFFVLHYSHFAVQCRYIKNLTMQLHFLMLPPCDCIAIIVNNFMKGTTFENQNQDLGGIGD